MSNVTVKSLDSERFDNLSPEESIGAFDGSGQWIELFTVRDLRSLTAALAQCDAEPVVWRWRFMKGQGSQSWNYALKQPEKHCDTVVEPLYLTPPNVREHTIKECAEIAATFEEWGDYSGDLETAATQIKDRILSLLKEGQPS